MNNLIHINFKTRSLEPAWYRNEIPEVTIDKNMFEVFDETMVGFHARFGQVPLKNYTYPQKFGTKFDTYGFGCVHNSIHQYRPKKNELWNRPCPIMANLRDIDTFLSKQSGKTIQLGHKSDAFMWLEQKYKMSRHTLELANKYGVKLEILTISDLVAHVDYLDLIKMGDHTVKMIMGYQDETDEESRIISPGAPSIKRRLLAIDKLKEFGIVVELIYKKRTLKSKKVV